MMAKRDLRDGIFLSLIERARAGDIISAVEVLDKIIRELEAERPLPDLLRLYLLDALKRIVRSEPLVRYHRESLEERSSRPHPRSEDSMDVIRRALAEARERERKTIDLIGDAREVLNLKPRRGNRLRSLEVFHLEAAMLHCPVTDAMKAGSTFEQAVAMVAEAEGVSESTVVRAWEWRDQYYAHKGCLLAQLVWYCMHDREVDFEEALQDVAARTGAAKQAIRRAWKYWKDRFTVIE